MKKLMLALMTLTSVMTFAKGKGGYAPKKKAAAVAPAPVIDPAVIAAQKAQALAAEKAAEAAKLAAAKAAEDAKNPFNDILAGFNGIQSGLSFTDKLAKLTETVGKISNIMDPMSAVDVKTMDVKKKQAMTAGLTSLSKSINTMLKEYLESYYFLTYTNLTRSFVNSDPIVFELLRCSDATNKYFVKLNPGNLLVKSGRYLMNHKKMLLAAYAILNVSVKLNRAGGFATASTSLGQAGSVLARIVLP
jgi:hypothetical protein